MSTERKPGSRGVREITPVGRLKPESKFGSEPMPPRNENPKGSSRTVSPKRAFKKRK